MKKLLFMAVLLGVAFYFGRPYIEKIQESGTYKGTVRRRVDYVLDGWKKGGTQDTNVLLNAACYWCKGTITLSMDEMSSCTNGFDAFRRERDLLRKISSFEIRDIDAHESGSPRTADVTLAIEGKPYRWRVVENEPISWALN